MTLAEEQTRALYRYAPKGDADAYRRFDLYLRRTPTRMPLFLHAGCFCGGRPGAHRTGCPLDEAT